MRASPTIDHVALLCYPTIGGSGRVATNLAARLVRRGVDVHLVSYERPVWLPDGVRFHPVSVREYPLLKYPPYDQALAIRLAEIHEEHGVQLFHAHYAIPHAVAVRLAAALLDDADLRLVTTLHGTDITLVGSDPAYRRAVSWSLDRSNVVTAVSESLIEDTRERIGYQGPIVRIPNFVETEQFRPGTRPRWVERERSQPRQLVHVSTFRPVKRTRELCRAVAALRERIPLRLRLVGDGPELEETVAWCEQQGFGDDLEVIGAVAEPAEYMADADLYVFASETESFGLGVLEAMACGVPVVGPRVGGVPEVVGSDAGMLVEPGDSDALMAACERMLSDAEAWRAASHHARQRAQDCFDAETIVEDYMLAYRAALEA